jgi:predicted nucleic acid-binding protein
MAGVTLDAGPLILLDQGKDQMTAWLKAAYERDEAISTPAVVVAEVWRPGPRAARLARALAVLDIVDVDELMGREAGELLARLPEGSRRVLAIDALVVASAKRRGDFVLTTDLKDVGPLASVAGVDVRTP